MWADKYRATNFVDLLGDERIHRDIMRWLKHWDFCVFNREIPTQPSFKSQPIQNIDPFQRPLHKILMIHGPPGLGKTTLAHVAAKIAGYDVIEINASDERSGTAAKERIIEAVETLGLDKFGRRGKERCIILDECDGGDANFIRVLLELIQSDEKANLPIKKKTKKRSKPLLRPIICICNDLYVPLSNKLI
jgi:chromosome transmission fidelity protein 18